MDCNKVRKEDGSNYKGYQFCSDSMRVCPEKNVGHINCLVEENSSAASSLLVEVNGIRTQQQDYRHSSSELYVAGVDHTSHPFINNESDSASGCKLPLEVDPQSVLQEISVGSQQDEQQQFSGGCDIDGVTHTLFQNEDPSSFYAIPRDSAQLVHHNRDDNINKDKGDESNSNSQSLSDSNYAKWRQISHQNNKENTIPNPDQHIHAPSIVNAKSQDHEPWQINRLTTDPLRLPFKSKLTRKLLPVVTHWWWATQLDENEMSSCKRKRPNPENPASNTDSITSTSTSRSHKAVRWHETHIVTDVRYRPVVELKDKHELFYDGCDYSRFRKERNAEMMHSQNSFLVDLCNSFQETTLPVGSSRFSLNSKSIKGMMELFTKFVVDE